MKNSKINKICKYCGHKMSLHINKSEGYRCHGINYDYNLCDSVQCECKLDFYKKKHNLDKLSKKGKDKIEKLIKLMMSLEKQKALLIVFDNKEYILCYKDDLKKYNFSDINFDDKVI